MGSPAKVRFAAQFWIEDRPIRGAAVSRDDGLLAFVHGTGRESFFTQANCFDQDRHP